MAIGRNDPCPCGSGRKHKRCCLSKVQVVGQTTKPDDLTPSKLEAVLARISDKPPIQTRMGDQRIRAVGRRIYSGPADRTFCEFLWYLLTDELGDDWVKAELQTEEPHQIARWYYRLYEWQKANTIIANRESRGWSALPSGDVHALTSLAYDVYQLAHAECLADKLRDRLRDRHEFQGVRYEIAVAALLLRSGFTLEFLQGERRHCEFIATHELSGASVGIEVKSRRKAGVLHQRGELDEEAILRSDVRGLFERAIGQKPEGLPFVIFIDVNSPPAIDKDPLETPWGMDLKNCFKTHDAIYSGKEDPSDPFNAVVITNFSTHYYATTDADHTGERFLIKSRKPLDALSNQVLDAIWQGVSRYGFFPEDLEEG